MVDSTYTNASGRQSERVDGGLIIHKSTMIFKNEKSIDAVYEREKKVTHHSLEQFIDNSIFEVISIVCSMP